MFSNYIIQGMTACGYWNTPAIMYDAIGPGYLTYDTHWHRWERKVEYAWTLNVSSKC